MKLALTDLEFTVELEDEPGVYLKVSSTTRVLGVFGDNFWHGGASIEPERLCKLNAVAAEAKAELISKLRSVGIGMEGDQQ
jgi:hypothetical protein